MNPNRAPLFLLAALGAATGCASSQEDPSSSSAQPISAAECAARAPWAAWTPYVTGEVVTYDGTSFVCIQAHMSQPGWAPDAVPALWSPAVCAGNGSGADGGGTIGTGAGGTGGGETATAGGGVGSGSGASTSGGSGSSSSTAGGEASTCNASAWVYMGSDASACDGNLGEACGWTTDNEGQGYHCQAESWGTGCEPGGATCPSGVASGSSGSGAGSAGGVGSGTGSGSGSTGGFGSSGGTTPTGFVFSPYKDTSINLDWDTDAIQTDVGGAASPLTSDLLGAGGSTVTLAFATGECGSENWAGVGGAAMASANVPTLTASGVKYILSTGGAAGSFTCGTDAGFATFVNRWASSGLLGVDFDIEAGQSESVIQALIARIQSAHASFPGLRFSLTVATLANNNGASTAQSLGSGVTDSLNTYGDQVIAAVHGAFGSAWPSYVTVDLMVMDYGSPSDGVCVVNGGACDMGQSALQAAYNLHDASGVPYANIELTPMIGQNDASSEHFTLADVDTVATFAISQGLAGVHFWSYDRDVDCAAGSASATCSSMGSGYAGPNGYLKRFLADGLK